MNQVDSSILNAKYKTLLPEANRTGADETSLAGCFTLLSVADSIFNACHERLARYQLSEGRFAVLLLLRQSSSKLTPSELADQAGVTRATMTGLLDGLVRDGFVNREEVEGNRRSLAVSLTAKGQKVMVKVIPLQLKWLESLFEDVPLGGRKQLIECLRAIGRKVQHEKRQAIPTK
jgi:DNA-binding MarR family transcriptional regulator